MFPETRSSNFWDFVAFLLPAALIVGRKAFVQYIDPAAGAYETIFISAIDVCSAFVAGAILFRFSKRIFVPRGIEKNSIVLFGLAIIFCAALSVFFAPSRILALASFARFALIASAACSIFIILKEKSRFITTVNIVILLAVFEACVALFQFARQGSVGLGSIGEPDVNPVSLGVAKVALEGGRALRAYGTFPHPNVLAAFLLMGIVAIAYVWFRFADRKFEWNFRESAWVLFKKYSPILVRSIILSSILFILIAGLTLTFSRAAWATAAIFLFLATIFFLCFRHYRRHAIKFAVVAAASISITGFILAPFVAPRFGVAIREPAVTLRLDYIRIGSDIIKHHPFGVGIGNQVAFARNEKIYEKFGMSEAWQWQPVHNIYLLMASEIGVLGLAAFLGLIASLFIGRRSARGELHEKNLESMFAKSILGAFLFLGCFDHFFWTLPQGQLMLWLAVGMVVASKKPLSSFNG